MRILPVLPASGALEYLSWRSNWAPAGALINTETTAAGALGLGAGARLVYEAGLAPLEYDHSASYYYRSACRLERGTLTLTLCGISELGETLFQPS